jgi:hypothetical protein
LYATAYNGEELLVDATAFPLFAATGDMHGVVNVFWLHDEANGT